MRRKERIIIFLGTIICIVILSLTPTTSAVERKSTQESNINESEKTFMNGENHLPIKEFILRHPILFLIVVLQLEFRFSRGYYLEDISSYWDKQFVVTHPLLFIRGRWLQGTWEWEAMFWDIVSHVSGWNWPYFL
jgi:hypothetical protein